MHLERSAMVASVTWVALMSGSAVFALDPVAEILTPVFLLLLAVPLLAVGALRSRRASGTLFWVASLSNLLLFLVALLSVLFAFTNPNYPVAPFLPGVLAAAFLVAVPGLNTAALLLRPNGAV